MKLRTKEGTRFPDLSYLGYLERSTRSDRWSTGEWHFYSIGFSVQGLSRESESAWRVRLLSSFT